MSPTCNKQKHRLAKYIARITQVQSVLCGWLQTSDDMHFATLEARFTDGSCTLAAPTANCTGWRGHRNADSSECRARGFAIRTSSHQAVFVGIFILCHLSSDLSCFAFHSFKIDRGDMLLPRNMIETCTGHRWYERKQRVSGHADGAPENSAKVKGAAGWGISGKMGFENEVWCKWKHVTTQYGTLHTYVMSEWQSVRAVARRSWCPNFADHAWVSA